MLFSEATKIFEEDGYVLNNHPIYGECFVKSFEADFIVSTAFVCVPSVLPREAVVRIERKEKANNGLFTDIFTNLIQDKYVISLNNECTLIIESSVIFIDMFLCKIRDNIDIVYSYNSLYYATAIIHKTKSITEIKTKYDSGDLSKTRFEISIRNSTSKSNEPFSKKITFNDLIKRDLFELVDEIEKLYLL
jgi:hypothetical protein